MTALPRWLWPFGRSPRPLVVVLPLQGAIGSAAGLRPGLTLAAFAGRIEAAFSVKGAKAVALTINSPGGSAVQSLLLHRRIVALAQEKGIPVIAFAEDVAASGGYMLALAADEIFVNEASLVGSIGVVSASFGFPGLLERLGIERRVHAAGERKAMLDPFSPERAEDVARIEDIQRSVHETFKDLVRTRRAGRLADDESRLFTGNVWVGAEAVRLGLVDGIGDLRTEMRKRFGDTVRFRTVERRRGPFALPFWRGSGSRQPAAGGLGFDLVAALELRALWARFGL